MSKIIKYNDYIQINPDERILSLDKKEKIVLIDNLLSDDRPNGRGLKITYDLSHSGRKINNRIYSTRGQQKGIDSLINPYPKPILRNHDQEGEPIGRFLGGVWQNLYDEASEYLQSSQKVLDVQSAFSDDDPMKIYSTMKALNLIKDKQWPGLGRMRVEALITDEDAIKKFIDGRYLTFSAGSTTNRHVCSICEQDWMTDGVCEHRHGQTYDGEICVFITGDFMVLEGSVVNTPADDLSQMVHMEMIDSENENKESPTFSYSDELILSDSYFNLGDFNGLQTTKEVNDENREEEKEEEKEEIDREYDHSMEISEEAMQELHAEGVTYIEETSGSQKMTIQVVYNGTMREDTSISTPNTEEESDMSTESEAVIDNEDEKDLIVEETEDSKEEEAAEAETLDEDNLQGVDWNILDLALEATMAQANNALSAEERKELPDSAFCGPERSFPISDCSHVDLAKSLIDGSNFSEATKNALLNLIDEKSKSLECDSSEEKSSIEVELDNLKEKYNSLEEKFITVVKFFELNNKITSENDDLLKIDSEKNEDTVENTDTNDLNLEDKDDSSKVLSNMNEVNSPSEHAREDSTLNEVDALSKLGAFEQKIVIEYKNILSEYGKDAANSYLHSKSTYLPRGFNPNNF